MEEEETLHFVAITDDEKKLLNIYRNFRDDFILKNDIDEQIDDIIECMVRHSVEEMALEESIATSRKKKIPPYQVFMKIKADVYDSTNKESTNFLDGLVDQWTKVVMDTINGDLVELTNK